MDVFKTANSNIGSPLSVVVFVCFVVSGGGGGACGGGACGGGGGGGGVFFSLYRYSCSFT